MDVMRILRGMAMGFFFKHGVHGVHNESMEVSFRMFCVLYAALLWNYFLNMVF